jgi:hypothetical protein
LLKTKAEVQFDWTVDRAVEPIFSVFHGSNRGQFLALFSRFYCPVGRGSQRAELPVWLTPDRLIAGFSKIFHFRPLGLGIL